MTKEITKVLGKTADEGSRTDVTNDPLQGLRALVVLAAVNAADQAAKWEESGGDVVQALLLRQRTREYMEIQKTLTEMGAQLKEVNVLGGI